MGKTVVLISTYELGHQPFGLASPAAWLREAGARVVCLDVAVQPLDEAAVAEAALVALYLPMHTATRLATALIPRLRALAPRAHLCCFGLYAPANRELLHRLGAQTLIGGEFEAELVALYKRLTNDQRPTTNELASTPGEESSFVVRRSSFVVLERLAFRVPDRSDLPPLASYARMRMPDGSERVAGYTESTRGCKHRCRHCPIVPVYGGRFRAVPREVVLADIRRQVVAGAQHITFGDPDFFNGPGHALPLVHALHDEFPHLTYDVTIKVEHLLQHSRHLPALRDTGCLLVTSAVESVDDTILAIFDKRHTRADVVRAVALLREVGLALNPTFVAFTPWTTRATYLDFLRAIRELELVESVAPVQYAIRLLIPAGSLLLELPEVRALVGPFDDEALCYRWAHPDPAMDALQRGVMRAVHQGQRAGASRQEIYERVWALASGESVREMPGRRHAPRALVPHMSEPWYC
ncbi:MAG TPA: CUAEP/CCAEP-tail radical SAM protein [Roseiflexaceae bacterium]|nr:CUAEP/CCAEP-tail radical SAM protein [Roseiflexaceae bacterium]